MAWAWRHSEKLNIYIYTSLLQSYISYLINEGADAQEIVNELKKAGRIIADLMHDHFVSMMRNLPSTIQELPSFLNLLLKFLIGRYFSEMRMEAGEESVRVVCRIKRCPLCFQLHTPIPEVPLCLPLAGIIERICEDFLEDLGMKSVKCEETRCISRGEEFCEFVLELSR